MSAKAFRWKKVILFGDSLTQRSFNVSGGFWGALLADKLQRVADVVCRGFSGYNSALCNVAAKQIFSAEELQNVAAFTLCLGANDAVLPGNMQHVPLEQYTKNLDSIIEHLKGVGLDKNKIILMTPPPYSMEKMSIEMDPSARDNCVTGYYANACRQLAKNKEISVVDLYGEMMKDEHWPRFLDDGLHFSQEGGIRVFNLLWPYVEKCVGTKHGFSSILPVWTKADFTRPETILD